MRVAIIGNTAKMSINFRGPMIREMVGAGWDVHVFAPDWTEAERNVVHAWGAITHGFRLKRDGLNPMEDLASMFALKKLLCEVQPDAVLTWATKTNVWGMLAAAWAGVPRRVAMVAGMGYAFTDGPNGRSFKQRLIGGVLTGLYHIAFRVANTVIVQNPDDAKELQHLCRVDPQKIERINGTGVALPDWPLHPPHTTPVTFTLVARLLREKGVLEFVHAARIIKERHPSTRFLVLGALDDNPGSLRESDIQPWVCAGVIEWPGQVDVKPWLAQTSVFVLPSYREGVPRSTQEAMAMGRPVITTDVPGCRETVVHGVNGYLIPPRNVPALVEAMEQFINNPAHIETMGKESRRLAEERFDVRTINAHMMRILCE